MDASMPLDFNRESIPVLGLGTCLTGAVGSSVVHIGPFPEGTSVVSLYSTANCHVVTSSSASTNATSSSGFIPAGFLVDIATNKASGGSTAIYVHVIQDGSSTGTIYVTERV